MLLKSSWQMIAKKMTTPLLWWLKKFDCHMKNNEFFQSPHLVPFRSPPLWQLKILIANATLIEIFWVTFFCGNSFRLWLKKKIVPIRQWWFVGCNWIFWPPFDKLSPLDDDWKFLVAIQHTLTIAWWLNVLVAKEGKQWLNFPLKQMKFFGHHSIV